MPKAEQSSNILRDVTVTTFYSSIVVKILLLLLTFPRPFFNDNPDCNILKFERLLELKIQTFWHS